MQRYRRLGLVAGLLLATFVRPTISLPRPDLEMVVVVDITQSMNVMDMHNNGQTHSRLDHVKGLLDNVLSALPCGTRIGWGVFTEHRSFLLLAPLEVCAHPRELRGLLRRIDGSMAWSGSSEVAKGLYGGMRIVDGLPSRPALIFITDGHEAPPVNPNHRPNMPLARDSIRGVILGVGGDVPQPIPKTDPSGNSLGHWTADDVLQVDPRQLGRGGSEPGEMMVDTEPGDTPPLPGASPGREHLSSLREDYLRLLADETGLAYHRLSDMRDLQAAFASKDVTLNKPSPVDLRPLLAGLALMLLLWPHLHRRKDVPMQHATHKPGPA